MRKADRRNQVSVNNIAYVNTVYIAHTKQQQQKK